MTRVRKLDIEELERSSDVGKMMATVAELENLDLLILRGYRFRIMPCLDEIVILHSLARLKLEGLLTRLPDSLNFPPNISNLTLFNTCLDQDPMPVLEKLPNLARLKLRNAYTGQQMAVSHDGFPVLQHLWVGEMWHLRDLQLGDGALPKLKVLEISHCPYLKKLPKDIVTNLSELKVLTTKTIAKKIQQEEDFKSKIRHVDIQP